MTIEIDLPAIAGKAQRARYALAIATSQSKNQVLKAIEHNLKEAREEILAANREDLALAKANNLSQNLLDRLSLQDRFENLIEDIDLLVSLKDPIGEVFDTLVLPNGMKRSKMRTPIGVLGVIYESRPNVTIDVSLLAIKSGNCAILRGGSETLHTNKVLVHIVQKALESEGLPKEIIQLIESPDRILVEQMLRLHTHIDLIIPRGSQTLQQFCREHSTIPVVTGGIGICHLYVDESAQLDSSMEVIINAKTRRPYVCNALDTLLVHKSLAGKFIPNAISRLQSLGVKFKLDEKAFKVVTPSLASSCTKAVPSDWDTEWLSLTLGIKVVENLDEAIAHIESHSTHHSDGILTENEQHAKRFIQAVDSAAVYVNASTCFTDGGQFGLGGEVAVSTQKLHARGPIGLQELTTYKWVIHGNYQIRS